MPCFASMTSSSSIGSCPWMCRFGSTLRLAGVQELEMLRRTLLDQQSSPELVNGWSSRTADDLTVAALRPHALADHWGVPRRSVLELFLLATRAGLLEFRWELLCPLCRGDKKSTSTLSGIQARVHCDACNVDFSVNFDQSVELTFHPSPAVRQVATLEFCIGGPQVTPHIAVQQLPDQDPAKRDTGAGIGALPGAHSFDAGRSVFFHRRRGWAARVDVSLQS